MAQVEDSNIKSGVEPEKLIEFIDELRRIGFNVGTQQYFAVQDLLILLATQGRLPAEPEELKTWLSPVLCTSPKEQESFYREFDRWLKQQREPKTKSRLGRSRKMEGTEKRPPRNLLMRRAVFAVAILLLVTVGAIVVLKKRKPSSQPDKPVATTSPSPVVSPSITEPAPVSDVDRPRITLIARSSPATTPTPPVAPRKKWVETYSTYFKQIRLGAVGIPFLIVGIWWLRRNYRNHSLLEKWSTTKKPRLEQVTVGGVTAGLFRETGFRRIAQELRRHRLAASSDLDVEPTVGATIRAGGRFTPIYSSRRVSPEYLVLIDRVTFRDQQAQLEDKLTSRLVEDNVFVDRYYFHRDPRICRREDPTASHLTLRDLAALHPDHYLIVFSDGAGFISPVSGRPQRWLESFSAWPGRALLTEQALADWGYREWALASLGFAVLPASKTGLELLVETINARTSQRTITGDWSKRYPKLVQERPERWLEPSAPEPAVLDELCEQLRAFLGDEDYAWLGACAVYPVLQWDLTLYFGIKLARREAFEERLLSLVRLPWFRHGVMPNWLRERLISDLPADREQIIRQTLEDLLITSLEQPSKGFTLDIARQGRRDSRAWQTALRFIGRTRSRRLKRLLQAWIETEPEHSPLRDYVFLRFVAGGKTNKLAVSVPDTLRRVFVPKRASLGLRPISAVLLAGIVSLVGWVGITRTQPLPSPVGSNQTANAGIQPVAISEMYMAKADERGRPGPAATSFDQDDVVQHCVVKLSTAQPGTRIKFAWNRMEGNNVGSTIENAEYVTAGLEDKVEASLALPREDRRGKYEVQASLDGKSWNSVEYSFVSTQSVARPTPAPRSARTGLSGLAFIPAQGVAQAGSRFKLQALLEKIPANTSIRISVDPAARVTYNENDLGYVTDTDIRLDEGAAISDDIYVSSAVPGRVEVRGRVLPLGPTARAVIDFTAPRASRIIFDDEPREILSDQTAVPISVRLTDETGSPANADRTVEISFRLGSADDAFEFNPPVVVIEPGNSVGSSYLHLKSLPKKEIRLFATSAGYASAMKTILIRSEIEKLMLAGPIEVTRGTSAEFIVRLIDKDGKPTTADRDRLVNLSATSGTWSPNPVTIPEGEDRAIAQYRSSGSGTVLLKAESEGLPESSLEIAVVIFFYWLALAALVGGLAGGLLAQIPRDYRMRRVLPLLTGRPWELGLIGRVLGSSVFALCVYWIVKAVLYRLMFPTITDVPNVDSLAAAFCFAIAGFASLALLERLVNLYSPKSQKTGNTDSTSSPFSQ